MNVSGACCAFATIELLGFAKNSSQGVCMQKSLLTHLSTPNVVMNCQG